MALGHLCCHPAGSSSRGRDSLLWQWPPRAATSAPRVAYGAARSATQDRRAESGDVTGDSPSGCRGPTPGCWAELWQALGADNHPSIPSALTATATSFQGEGAGPAACSTPRASPHLSEPICASPPPSPPCPPTQKHGPKQDSAPALPPQCTSPCSASQPTAPQPAHGPPASLPGPPGLMLQPTPPPNTPPTPLRSQTAALSPLPSGCTLADRPERYF